MHHFLFCLLFLLSLLILFFLHFSLIFNIYYKIIDWHRIIAISQYIPANIIKINKIMNKSSIEKMLKADGHYAGDLVSLDFKSESLHLFLQNVVQLVNQHSQRINTLEIDKITVQQVKKANLNLTNASKVAPSLEKQIPSLPHLAKTENFDESVEGFCTNLTSHSNALNYLYESIKKAHQKIDGLTGLLDGFQTKENTKQAIRKAGLASKKLTEDQNEKVLARFKELQMKTNKKISEFENTTKQIEKKTLWKISECQNALLKKITPEYVEKALEQLQSKIHNDTSNNKNQQMNELKFNVDTLKIKLQGLSKTVDQYEKQNKQMLKELDQLCKTLEKKEKIEENKRENDLKNKEILIKIDRLQKRQDPHEVQYRISKLTAEHTQKLNAHNQKIKKLDGDISSVNNVMSSLGGGADGGGMDPHKLCHMDGQVRRLRDSNRTNELKLQSLDDEVKTKLLVFEERIMTTLGMLKGQDNFVSREQMYESLSRLREPVTQKLNENQNLMHELNSKLTKLQIFEKATKRKIKQMTRGDDLNKILDMKMNIGQAQAQFNSQGMKIQNLQIILNKIRMEMDANSSFLRMLQDEMNEPEEGINIIGPKQKVFPAKCLGCGQKHIPTVHDNNMMQGTDGKYYKVDLKNSYLYDQRQVYGVTPSQIAVYDSGVKRRITSTSNRPTSSRTNLRPSSAKHF